MGMPLSAALLAPKLIDAALLAASPGHAIAAHLRCDAEAICIGDQRVPLGEIDTVLLLAVGKAAVPMAQAAFEIIGTRRPMRGVVCTKRGHAHGLTQLSPALHIIESAHPIPDENSLRAADVICAALANLTPRTLVLACISGGASALVVAPHAGISLASIQAINGALLRGGADIFEMNAVRSRLDRLKGGGLVQLAQPARVFGLVLSDVVGDSLHVIASGMTSHALAHNTLVGSGAKSCAAVAACAAEHGWQAHVVSTTQSGDAGMLGAAWAREAALSPISKPTIWIRGGETTVQVTGSGKGGRNQHLALAAALALPEVTHPSNAVYVLSLATDGTDGPTDAAGAIASVTTVERALALGLDATDHFKRNDAYPLFAALGDLLLTGPTGTNVADVMMVLATPN